MKRIFPLTCALLFAFCSSANADLVSGVVIDLTADEANSTPAQFGSSLGATLTDGFAYDLTDPTSTSPNQTFNGARSYHADEPPVEGTDTPVDVILNYTLNHTVTAPNDNLVLDVWGRLGSNGSLDRDDNFDVELFDAAGNQLAFVNTGLTDDATQYVRADLGTLAVGTVITDLRITGIDSEPSNNNNNNFTLQEVRLAAGEPAAVPEPTSAVLIGLSAIGLATRRRRR